MNFIDVNFIHKAKQNIDCRLFFLHLRIIDKDFVLYFFYIITVIDSTKLCIYVSTFWREKF
jgi:hypothetical protein